MKELLSGMFYKWLAITVFCIIAFRSWDYIFSVTSIFSFFDAGFIAFVILWCEQQDKIRR